MTRDSGADLVHTQHTPHTTHHPPLTSPKKGEVIDLMLLPNLSLRNLIEAIVEEQKRAFAAAGAGTGKG